MWTLFTAALAKGTSTTQVSIINTSTNFVLTALLGLAIFSEALPPLWWAGAAAIVGGWLGATYSARASSQAVLRIVLGCVLLIAAVKFVAV